MQCFIIYPCTQCAAVNTYFELIKLPPQNGAEPPFLTRPACQGKCVISALSPPTTF